MLQKYSEGKETREQRVLTMKTYIQMVKSEKNTNSSAILKFSIAFSDDMRVVEKCQVFEGTLKIQHLRSFSKAMDQLY